MPFTNVFHLNKSTNGNVSFDNHNGRFVVIDNPNLPSDHRNQTRQLTYKDLCEQAHSYKEKNDCAVIATCLLANRPYSEIHALYKDLGRRKRCGVNNGIILAALARLGFKHTDVKRYYPGRTVRAVGPQLPKDGKFLLFSANHVATVVNGVVEDWSAMRGLQIVFILQIQQKDEPAQKHEVHYEHELPRWKGNIPASTAIRNLAERELAKTLGQMREAEESQHGALPVGTTWHAPRSKRWWLSLRARVHAVGCKHGLKATTMSVELGKWQAEIGFPMQEMLK